jgi:hypothetical protein
MKNPILLAAPIALLAACASMDGATPATRTAAADGAALYCWESKVVTEGGGLSCNWAKTAGDACRSSSFTLVSQGAIASGPSKARRCENGEWLVMVTTR